MQPTILEGFGRPDARRPYLQVSRDGLSAFEQVPRGVGTYNSDSCAHIHAQHSQFGCGRRRECLWKCSENARSAFQQGQAEPLANVSQAIAGSQINRPAELGCQLNACGAAADDGDINVVNRRAKRTPFSG